MARTRPLLDPAAPGWKHDLPGPEQTPIRVPNPAVLPNPPNHVDDLYLELAHSTLRVRGVLIWSGIFCCSLTIVFACFFLYILISFPYTPPVEFLLIGIVAVSVGIWIATILTREDIAGPRDEPIRFNRLRRKVYVYRFHHDWLRPFSKSAWGVRPTVYNWDDLHAEACSVYGPMGTGGLIENITLTVLKPGTREVLDRFIFAHDIDHGEQYWAMAQLFMQQGPQALPTFPHPPRDWNNEPANFNLARRFAPKVQWPDEMDLESRTAPELSVEPMLTEKY